MRFRLPDFHDIQHLKVVRLSAPRTGSLYTQEIFLVLIFNVSPCELNHILLLNPFWLWWILLAHIFWRPEAFWWVVLGTLFKGNIHISSTVSNVTKNCQATREYFSTGLYILLTFPVNCSKWTGCLAVCLNFWNDLVKETQKDTCKFTPQPPMTCPDNCTYLQFTLPVFSQQQCVNVNVLYSLSIMKPCLQFSFPIYIFMVKGTLISSMKCLHY